MPTLVLMVILAIAGAGAGGGAIWALKKNAVDACNANWQADIAKANLAVEKANQEKDDAIEKVQMEARSEIARVENMLGERERQLSETLTNVPLSQACSVCLVPESHVWGMRLVPGRPARSSGISGTPATSRPSIAPASAAEGVPATQAGERVLGQRAPVRPGVRRRSEKTD